LVGKVKGPGVNGRGSIPGKARFLYSPYGSGPTQLPSQWVPRVLSGCVKRQRREADHSRPPSAEIKNNGAILPVSHMPLWHGA
jgi:hypothetical protein